MDNTNNAVAVETLSQPEIKKDVRSRFNWAMLWIVVYAIVATVLQVAFSAIFREQIQTTSWGQYIMILVPIHLIACPLALFFFSKRKYETPKKNKLSPKQFIGFVLVMTAFAAIGLIISTVLASLIDLSSAEESVTSLTTGDNLFLKILTVGIVAPIGEELIFRKIVVDATHKYSEKFAIFFSGLLFSLFHGNFVQFFFTFLVGMLFAYVYTRTGNIFYSMALHMLMNLTTSVITASVMALNNDIIAGVWMLILFGLAIAGFVIFCIKVRRLKFEKHIDGKVSLGTILGAAFGNVFTILFLIFTISLFVASMAPALFG